MKNSEIDQINTIINKLNNNTAEIDHVKNLFTILRFQKGTDKVIQEIGHFINHEERDRGTVYKLAIKFINSVLFLKNGMGGMINTIPPYVTQNELLRQLKASLLHLKFNKTTLSKLDGCSYVLMKFVIEILDESILLIDNHYIIKCELNKEINQNNVTILWIRIFPQPTSDKTLLGGPSVITFGPNHSIEASFMQAFPEGVINEDLALVRFKIDN